MPTFDTPAPISVMLNLNIGDVRIRASDRDDTVVEIREGDPDSAEDATSAQQTRVEYADGRLLIRAPRPWTRYSPFRTGGAVEVVLDLPTGSDVTCEATVAEVHADGRIGACRITTSVGGLTLDETGPMQLSTTGRVAVDVVHGDAEVSGTGAIRIGLIDGTATIENANGDIRLGQVDGDLRCRTANGDVFVGTALAGVSAKSASGDVRVGEIVRGATVIETANGQLEIGIRPGTAAQLDVHSRFGRVHHELEAADGPEPSDETATVRARTSNGDIVIGRPRPTLSAP